MISGMTTTLIMDAAGTYHAADGPQLIPAEEWAAQNDCTLRSVMRWISAGEIQPTPVQEGPKKRWMISATAVRVKKPASEEPPMSEHTEVALVPETSTEVAAVQTEIEIDDDELAEVVFGFDVEGYLARCPGHLPVRIAAQLLGLSVAHVKSNPDKFGIVKGGGARQADVIPKRVIIRELGLDRPIIVATGRA